MEGWRCSSLPFLWTGKKLMRCEGGMLLAVYAFYLMKIWPG
jgi:hypothetical protein